MHRFPRNDIVSLVGQAPRYDLAESVGPDLCLGELLAGDELDDLPLGYGTAAGDAQLREAIAQAHGVGADDVVVTAGGMQALFITALLLCEGGSPVVGASPLFPLAGNALRAVGAELRTWPLRFEVGYQPDLGLLRSLLSADTRLVSLASPQNPSGVAIPMTTLREIVRLVAAHAPQAYVLVDETYREATYGNEPVAASAVELGDRVISTGSLSKCHGAPGLRIGWAITRDAVLREQLVTAKFGTVLSCGRIDEALALRVLQRRERILGDRRALLVGNLAVTEAWVKREAAHVEWVRPDAGALCCVRLRPEVFDAAAVDRFHRALPAHEVRVGDGRWFGEEARVFRLGFGRLPAAELSLALEGLSAAMRDALSN